MSFVERFSILCPYLGESTIRGFTVRMIELADGSWLFVLSYVFSETIKVGLCTYRRYAGTE